MEKKQKHREPILYIVGNPKRAEEIRRVIEDEWRGNRQNSIGFYGNTNNAYFIGSLGLISYYRLDDIFFKEAVANGWMKEFKLQEKRQFKPFDKVVTRASEESMWYAGFYSHYDIVKKHILTDHCCCEYCLPYNGETAKLIGTKDAWKGGKE